MQHGFPTHAPMNGIEEGQKIYISIFKSIAQKPLPRKEENKFAFLIKSWDRSKPPYQKLAKQVNWSGLRFNQRGTESVRCSGFNSLYGRTEIL